MEMAIRHIDGRVIAPDEYKSICHTVNIAYRTHLESIEGPNKPRPPPLHYLRSYHKEAVKKALIDIEAAHPQVGWCSFHWKGFHLLQNHIQNRSNTAGKRLKKTSNNTSKTVHSPADPPPQPPVPVPAAHPPHLVHSLSFVSSKRKTPELDDAAQTSLSSTGAPNSTDNDGIDNLMSGRAPKKTRSSEGGTSGSNPNAALQFETALQLNIGNEDLQTEPISISHIRVDSSCTIHFGHPCICVLTVSFPTDKNVRGRFNRLCSLFY